MKNSLKNKQPKTCKLLCWSLQANGIVRPMICPECGEAAEVGYDMLGRACYFHKVTPRFPFKPAKAAERTQQP